MDLPTPAEIEQAVRRGCAGLPEAVVVLNVAEAVAVYRPTKEQKEAARQRRDSVAPRGSDEEYYSNLLEEYYKGVRKG